MVKYSSHNTELFNTLKKSNRKALADSYRLIRKDNPAMARLLWKRAKACETELMIKLYGPKT